MPVCSRHGTATGHAGQRQTYGPETQSGRHTQAETEREAIKARRLLPEHPTHRRPYKHTTQRHSARAHVCVKSGRQGRETERQRQRDRDRDRGDKSVALTPRAHHPPPTTQAHHAAAQRACARVGAVRETGAGRQTEAIKAQHSHSSRAHHPPPATQAHQPRCSCRPRRADHRAPRRDLRGAPERSRPI